jgi:eukaryotic-like serine/threonine-protein kinase
MRLGESIRRRREPRSKTRRTGPGRSFADGASRVLSRIFGDPRLLWAAGLLAMVGFAGGYLFSTRVLYPVPPPPGDLTPVPRLTGESLEEADRNLALLGLVLGRVDSLRHPSVPEGRILGQSPLPGQLSLEGDTVWVALSIGPERRSVPDVSRLRADAARTVLEAAGFSVVVDSVESGIPLGGVVAVVPPPGTEATVPREVRLSVSKGAAMVEMPLLLGMEEESATALLTSLGLVVGDVEMRFRFGRDQGMVVGQEPPSGSMVEVGSAVRLVVGRRGG